MCQHLVMMTSFWRVWHTLHLSRRLSALISSSSSCTASLVFALRTNLSTLPFNNLLLSSSLCRLALSSLSAAASSSAALFDAAAAVLSWSSNTSTAAFSFSRAFTSALRRSTVAVCASSCSCAAASSALTRAQSFSVASLTAAS
eukprot:GHRR01014358.1.p1 GENE.GHRR01014358.1~~GHRR01014358.1.p1  ORF type:complete len:144 (-),score=11.44 GHRR01014358.1:1008-1439(-)